MTQADTRQSLRTRLISSASLHHELKRDAELDGRSSDAEFHDRQALLGFESLGGDGS